MVKIWDIRSGNVVHSLASPPRPLDMDFDRNLLLIASRKNYIACWDLENRALAEPERPWTDGIEAGGTPLRRPPCALTMSVSQGVLAVAYSGKPIT